MDPACPDGPDVIAARLDRGALAQGPGADLGLYAATPGAFPASMAASAGLALLPTMASAQDHAAETFVFRAVRPSPSLNSNVSSGVSSSASELPQPPMALETAPLIGPVSAHAAAENISAPTSGASSHAAPLPSAEQSLIGMDAQGTLAASATAQAASNSATAPTVHAIPEQVVSSLTAPVLEPLHQTFDVLSSQTQALVSSLQAVTTERIDALEDTIGQSVTSVVGELDVLREYTSELAAETASTVSSTIGAVTDTITDSLDGLAGGDPAGGISTLTSLISAADIFAVSDEASSGLGSGLGLVDGIGAGAMLDMLALPDDGIALLGAGDTLHDTLSHLDDLHLGLG